MQKIFIIDIILKHLKCPALRTYIYTYYTAGDLGMLLMQEADTSFQLSPSGDNLRGPKKPQLAQVVVTRKRGSMDLARLREKVACV